MYHVAKNGGIYLLGQVKCGSCHPRSILFKVLADTVGLDCDILMVNILFHYSLSMLCFLFEFLVVRFD